MILLIAIITAILIWKITERFYRQQIEVLNART